MNGSLQLRQYLAHREAGKTRDKAAELTGMALEEARLTDIANERGEISLEPIPAAGNAAHHEGSDMAQKAKPGDSEKRGVTNLTEAKDIIKNAVPAILNLKEQRQAINEEIQSIRERVNAVGVPKKALDHAIKIREMDPEDRERFDEGFAIARDAIGLPVSRSLFDMIDTPAGQEGQEGDSTAVPPAALAKARQHLGTGAPDAIN